MAQTSTEDINPDYTTIYNSTTDNNSKIIMELSDISKQYKGVADLSLSNINIKLFSGEILGLIGRSGAGKSTIMNLLTRFYDPKKGTVYIDDQDIKSVTLSSLRKSISMVSQDIILFDDTVRANIAYANMNASEDEIKKIIYKQI